MQRLVHNQPPRLPVTGQHQQVCGVVVPAQRALVLEPDEARVERRVSGSLAGQCRAQRAVADEQEG